MIANIHAESNQFSTSIAYYNESLEISRKIDDEYNTQKNLTSLAFNFKNLGDRKESLAYMQRCLERTGDCWTGARQMYRNFDTAAGILNSFDYYAAAAEYEKAALQQALEAKDPVFEHRSYTHLGAIYSKLQDYTQARRYAEKSYQVAQAMSDERGDQRSIALSLLQLGHIYRQMQDYQNAAASYDDAIKIYNDINLFALLYEAHKGRLLCYIAQGNDSLAEEELQTVLAFFEQHRSKIREEKNRNIFFDLEQYVYDIAIDFEYSRKHDKERAFDYSEISRARSLFDIMSAGAEVVSKDDPNATIRAVSKPLILSSIKKTMPGDVQILQYSVLDDKLLIWVISSTKCEVAEEKITLSNLTEKALDYWQSISSLSKSDTEESRRQAIELYEILIKPVELLLEKDKQIFVIPDKALNYLPFNALINPSTGRYLIKDYRLSFAPSANTFLLSSQEADKRSGTRDEKVMAVGDPHFNRDAFPKLSYLPSSGKEAEEVSRCYNSGHCLVGKNARKTTIKSEMGEADVIHIASHYVIDEHNPMLSKLLLTEESKGNSKDQSSDSFLQAYDILQSKLPVTRLVALSACRTGIEQYYKGEGMIGMSRTFLAAGVPLVVASLWPVDSDLTADLMISFHKYRKPGKLSSAEALRQAQLDMIDQAPRQYNKPYYWAPFIVIGGHVSF
jgi:CHAT domain-containing protein